MAFLLFVLIHLISESCGIGGHCRLVSHVNQGTTISETCQPNCDLSGDIFWPIKDSFLGGIQTDTNHDLEVYSSGSISETTGCNDLIGSTQLQSVSFVTLTDPLVNFGDLGLLNICSGNIVGQPVVIQDAGGVLGCCISSLECPTGCNAGDGSGCCNYPSPCPPSSSAQKEEINQLDDDDTNNIWPTPKPSVEPVLNTRIHSAKVLILPNLNRNFNQQQITSTTSINNNDYNNDYNNGIWPTPKPTSSEIEITGNIDLKMENDLMRISGEITGLQKYGDYAVRIHWSGNIQNCSMTMGQMYDLKNITADCNGNATFNELYNDPKFDGVTSIIGRAVTIHEMMEMNDWQSTNGRLGCGVIGISEYEECDKNNDDGDDDDNEDIIKVNGGKYIVMIENAEGLSDDDTDYIWIYNYNAVYVQVYGYGLNDIKVFETTTINEESIEPEWNEAFEFNDDNDGNGLYQSFQFKIYDVDRLNDDYHIGTTDHFDVSEIILCEEWYSKQMPIYLEDELSGNLFVSIAKECVSKNKNEFNNDEKPKRIKTKL